MCMFLFILCACLVIVLVLVGRSLSTGALLTPADRAKISSKQSISSPANINYSLSIKDFSLNNLNLVDSDPVTSGITYNNSTEENLTHSDNDSTGRTMRTARISKALLENLSWRLPTEIKPTLYNLLLRPDFETKTFYGNISIHLNVNKPISYVAVHSNKLSITETSLVKNAADGGVHNVTIADSFDYPEKEFWVTELPEPLSIGDYVLNLTFNGSLTDRIVGFYQSSYNDNVKNITR